MDPAIIKDVFYHGQQISSRHFTSEYELLKTNQETAIFRRGFEFFLTARLERYDDQKDVIRVEFKFGKKNFKKDITRIRLLLPPHSFTVSPSSQWGIGDKRVIVINGNGVKDVMFKISIPPTAPVGVWSCIVWTNIKGAPEPRRPFEVPNDFYILFNPWSKEDSVFMENEVERDEYVRNESGKVWLGTWSNPQGRHWIFGQFDKIALQTAILLLDKSKLTPELRGDPVAVSRTISAMINSDNDNGLLVANWDGNYSDGISPYVWTGSRPIMEQYYDSGSVPVKYGLCWVFSAATVTVCRALGIPCRSTTVYVSAEGTKNITRNYDAFGKLVEDDQSGESLWNFHAWNDVWMARPDLHPGYGGWQIIDSTPQNHSDGIMICGPASVAALRQGQIGYQYNTDFVYNKLNANISFLAEEGESGNNRTKRNSYQAGKLVITKTPGPSSDTWDIDSLEITDQYKPQSDNGISINVTKRSIEGKRNSTTYFTFAFFIKPVAYGETLNLSVTVNNTSNSPRNVRYVLQARSVYYNGTDVSDGVIGAEDDHSSILPGERILSLTIPASKYIPKLVDLGMIRFYAYVEDIDTDERWANELSYIFNKVAVTIRTGTVYRVGETVEINIRFKNPLNVKLTNCFYMVEGAASGTPKTIKHPDVQPLEEVSIPANFIAGERIGIRRIVANFTSRELPNVNGSVVIKIEE